MADLSRPFMVMHPECDDAKMAETLKEAQTIAKELILEHGPAVVEIFSLTKIGVVQIK